MTEGELILVAGSLIAGALASALLAGRLRVPALLFFLALGMIIGSDGLRWIDFDDYHVAHVVGVIALALILFDGGLSTGLQGLRPVLRPAISLATVGTVVAAAVAGFAAVLLFRFSTLEGLLLGSILASTDGAAIFSVLRGSKLKTKLARTLEGEAGLNDPVAVMLVLVFTAAIADPSYRVLDAGVLFFQQIGIGLAVGLGVGFLASSVLKNVRLHSAGLYPVASLAVAALAFGGADSLSGSGFLAVYLAGLMLGSQDIPQLSVTRTFNMGLAWLAQVVMFLTLGLLVFPSQLPAVSFEAIIFSLIIMLLARPLGVYVATLGDKYTWPERILLSWAGLRGAVPVVLAIFPVLEGISHSVEFFNIVFFTVLLSTFVQGVSFEKVARSLKLAAEEDQGIAQV